MGLKSFIYTYTVIQKKPVGRANGEWCRISKWQNYKRMRLDILCWIRVSIYYTILCILCKPIYNITLAPIQHLKKQWFIIVRRAHTKPFYYGGGNINPLPSTTKPTLKIEYLSHSLPSFS